MEKNLNLITEYEKLLFQSKYEIWLNDGVFTLKWWMLLATLFIPWFIWYRFIDKKRLQEMVLYLFATSFIAVLLDEIGTSLSLWCYPINILPFFPQLISANYCVVPIIFSLIYQSFPKWKSFIIANIILTLVFSYIFEPVLVLAKLYVLISWKHTYSIPVYFFASIALKCFADKVKSVQNSYFVQ